MLFAISLLCCLAIGNPVVTIGSSVVLAKETNAGKSTEDDGSKLLDTDQSPTSKLSQVGGLNSRFERRLALYEILENANEKELERFFDYLPFLKPSNYRFEVESLLVEKWAMIDPQSILHKVEGIPEQRFRELVKIIFDEWFDTDLTAAVDFASRWNYHKKRMVFETSVLPRSDLTSKEKLRIAKRFDIEYIANSYLQEQIEEAPIDDVQIYWREFHATNKNTFAKVERDKLSNIAQSLVTEMGTEAFRLVNETVPNIDDRNRILPRVAMQIAQTDPEQAFQLAVGLMRDETNMLWNIVRKWAETEPQAAFEAVSEIADRRIRSNMQDAVLDLWTRSGEPRDLLERLGEFPENSRPKVQEKAIAWLARFVPEEALELTQEVSDATTRNHLENSIVAIWTETDWTSALGWVRSDARVQYKRTQLMEDILGRLARRNLELAWETALAEPVDKSGVGLEASVIRGIVPLSEDVALKLLAQTRNEQTKLLGMLSVGTGFVQMGSEESLNSAMNLSKLLKSEEHRQRYWKSLILGWIVYGKEQELYNRLDQFPTKELKQHAAQILLDSESSKFTVNQLKRLDSYIDDRTN